MVDEDENIDTTDSLPLEGSKPVTDEDTKDAFSLLMDNAKTHYPVVKPKKRGKNQFIEEIADESDDERQEFRALGGDQAEGEDEEDEEDDEEIKKQMAGFVTDEQVLDDSGAVQEKFL
jgi:hypothetical protein